MSHGTLKRIEAEAATIGVLKVRGRGDDPSAVCWQIVCARCEYTRKYGWPPTISFDVIMVNLRRADWTVKPGKPPRCPACKNRNSTPMGRADDGAELQSDSLTEPDMSNDKSASAQRIARAVFAALEDHFKSAETFGQPGKYEHGWSDAAIAKATGASEEHVAKTRSAAFGELEVPEDPDVIALRGDLEALKAVAADLTASAVAMEKRLETITARKKLAP